MLFVVTARPTERPTTVEKLLEVQGVLGLRETLTGHRNLYVGVVGKNASDVARVLGAIQDLNLEINSSEIGRERCLQPLEGFQTGGGTVGDSDERRRASAVAESIPHHHSKWDASSSGLKKPQN